MGFPNEYAASVPAGTVDGPLFPELVLESEVEFGRWLLDELDDVDGAGPEDEDDDPSSMGAPESLSSVSLFLWTLFMYRVDRRLVYIFIWFWEV